MRIQRTEIRTLDLEVPEGHVPCRYCKGKGLHSKYDQGWHSVFHDSRLAALEECIVCGGLGYVPESHYEDKSVQPTDSPDGV